MQTPDEDEFVDIELNIFRYQRETEYRDSENVKIMKWLLSIVVLAGLGGIGYIMWIAAHNEKIKL